MYESLLKTFFSGFFAESSRAGRKTGFIFRFARGKLPAPAFLCALLTVFFLLPFAVRSAESSETSSFCESQSTQGLKEDCTSLAVLYDGTGGDGWTKKTKWKTSNPLDQWYGVKVKNGRVYQVDLHGNSLSGTIPDISGLTELENLVLSANSLSGTVPATLNSLTKLEVIYLSKNDLSGTIPDLSGLAALKHIDMERNRLSGTITGLGKLEELISVYLSDNDLSGTVPSGLENLAELYLSNNRLSGTVSDLSSSEELNWLDLSGNNMGGTISGLNSLGELRWFDLSDNRLSGTVPDLSSLLRLKSAYLDGNRLSGTLSATSFPQMLVLIDLSGNRLSGTVPDLSSVVGGLNYLHLNDNGFTGSIPSRLGSMNLVGLDLSDNRLSGAIPAMESSSLAYLFLQNNSLSGTIPDLSSSPHLVELGLWGNPGLSGSITLHSSVGPEVVDRAALLVLYRENGGSGWTDSSNWLSPVLALGSWHGVTTGEGGRVTGLDLSGNGLTGEISDSLQALEGSLTTLDISNNSSLSGTLPPLDNLTTLNTCGTLVTVPDELQSLMPACD